MQKDMEEAEIFKFEDMSALEKMNRNKLAGPERTIIEMLSALNDFYIDRNTEAIN